VNESERAFNPGEERRERPLSLDPCRDDPETHLVFAEPASWSAHTRTKPRYISDVQNAALWHQLRMDQIDTTYDNESAAG
jgi:hypothetical protein